MKRYLLITIVTISGSLGVITGAHAADTWAIHERPVHEVLVQFGTPGGDLAIAPTRLTFQTNGLYKMVVSNPSDSIHYFSVPEFGTTVNTTKAVVTSRYPTDVYVSGGPDLVRAYTAFPRKEQHIQLMPGATFEWVFTPVKAGHYKFGCSIPEHANAGMVGDIRVS